jgi:hypothetical protein
MMDHTPLAVAADICGYAICSADNRLEHAPSMMNSLELNVSSTEHCFLAPVSFRRAPSERRWMGRPACLNATETVVGASCGRVEVEEGVEDALGVLTPG